MVQLILAIAAPVLFVSASAGAGAPIARLFAPRGRGADFALTSVALGSGLIALVLFAGGLAGILFAWFAWLVLAAPALLFAGDARRNVMAIIMSARGVLKVRGLFNRVLLGALLAVLALDLVSSLAPPTETDAMTVHILVPREYVGAHAIVETPDNWDSYMAMGPHVVYAALMLVTRGDVAPAVLHFMLGCLFVLWVWRLARRFGRSASLVAATSVATMPMLTHLVIAPMVDSFFALYSMGALVWLLEFLRRRSTRPLMASAVLASLSATAKYSGIVTVATVVFIAAAAALFTAGRRARLVAAVFALGIVAAFIMCPFYLRNYAWTGNPVFPTMKAVCGGPGWNRPRWDSGASSAPQDAILKHSFKNMLSGPWNVTVRAREVSSGESELIAPAFLVFLPLVVFLRTRRRFILHLALYCLVGYVLIYWTSPRPRARYFIPLMPALGVVAGAGLALLRKYNRPAFYVGRLVVLVGVLSGLAVAALYSWSFAKVVFRLTPSETFLSRSTDFYSEYAWMDSNLPADARVLVQATNDLYYVPRPAMRLGTSSEYTHCDSTAVFALDEGSTPEEAFAALERLGVTHVFTSAGFVSERNPDSSGSILWRLEREGLIEKIREEMSARGTRNPFAMQREEAVSLYRLNYGGAPK